MVATAGGGVEVQVRRGVIGGVALPRRRIAQWQLTLRRPSPRGVGQVDVGEACRNRGWRWVERLNEGKIFRVSIVRGGHCDCMALLRFLLIS